MADDDLDEAPTEPTDDERTETGADTPESEGETPPSEAGSDGDDERPEIEADERADLDLDVVDLDAVDDETDDDASATDDDGSSDESDGLDVTPDDGETWGDMYVDVLAVVLIAIVDEYGDGSREMDAADIEELANQPPIALNEQADRVMEQMGGTRDLPPGQALVVGSSVVGATVLLRETDVASDLVGELAAGLGGDAA